MSMYVCYLDESGTVEDAGTSHFVLLGLAIPCDQWKAWDKQITDCKAPFGLADEEIHTAWLIRRYPEQENISNFGELAWEDRRKAVNHARQMRLMNLLAQGNKQRKKETEKNFRKTAPYVHLSYSERVELVRNLATTVSRWSDARMFAELVCKHHYFRGLNVAEPMMEMAFTQLVQRFEDFLRNRGAHLNQMLAGLLVQDNNETVAGKLTSMMRKFHSQGTKWMGLDHIIETPMFVDSRLTGMVQMADLCAYATRRYVENGERDLFDRIYGRFDRAGNGLVGARHFQSDGCACRICLDRVRQRKAQKSLPLSAS